MKKGPGWSFDKEWQQSFNPASRSSAPPERRPDIGNGRFTASTVKRLLRPVLAAAALTLKF